MKKVIAALLILAMVLSLAGCARKTAVSIEIMDVGDIELVQIPRGLEGLSAAGHTVHMIVKKDGSYPFVIRADDGREYSFVMTYEKRTTVVETSDDVQYAVRVG